MRRAVQSLGEVALRVNDLDVMRDFYQRVVGLEPMRQFPAWPSSDSARDTAGWRSLFFRDPEGNLVELVCRDPELVPE